MNLWNIKNLEPPPVSTYKVNSQVDVNNLLIAFRDGVDCFMNQKYLATEAALLSRCIYRMKLKFRMDKGFKAMEKLNRCLLQYLRMNFTGIITNFYELLPKQNTVVTYLPSKSLLDFILVRLQGLSMLLYRIVETSQLAAHFMENKINIGHFWNVALIVLSMASRIWVLTRDLLRFCCKFYSEILPFREILQDVGQVWLPDHYQFPDSLGKWLNIDQTHLIHNVKTVNKNLASLLEVANVEMGNKNKYIYEKAVDLANGSNQIVEEPFVQLSSTNVSSSSNFFSLLEEGDVGQVIKREDIRGMNKVKQDRIFAKDVTENKKSKGDALASEDLVIKDCLEQVGLKTKIVKKKVKNKMKRKSRNLENRLNNIDSVDKLKEFIKAEKNLRNNNKDHISRKLDKLQWNILQKVIKKFIQKADKNIKNQSIVNKYLLKAKDVLKVSLS